MRNFLARHGIGSSKTSPRLVRRRVAFDDLPRETEAAMRFYRQLALPDGNAPIDAPFSAAGLTMNELPALFTAQSAEAAS